MHVIIKKRKAISKIPGVSHEEGFIKWNFTKFLFDRNEEIVARFEPTDMKSLKEKIEECL